MKHKVVTIDGLAGSGKTSLSRALAERLGYLHFSTGALWRGVGLLCLRHGISSDNEQAILGLLKAHSLEISRRAGDHAVRVMVDGQDVTDKLQETEISDATSRAARHQLVRDVLLPIQRDVANLHDLVAEGRDTGTVVFPTARTKFFVVADPRVRAERRVKQLVESGSASSEAELRDRLEIEIRARDERDSKREASPTVPAPDAIVIDNSNQPLTQLVENMYHAVVQSGAGQKA